MILLALLLSFTDVARSEEVMIRPDPVSVSISGSLIPLNVAVDGTTLIRKMGSASQIRVGSQVVLHQGQGINSFFYQSTADQILISALFSQKQSPLVMKLTFPKLESS